jgi:hypothetical protein
MRKLTLKYKMMNMMLLCRLLYISHDTSEEHDYKQRVSARYKGVVDLGRAKGYLKGWGHSQG